MARQRSSTALVPVGVRPSPTGSFGVVLARELWQSNADLRSSYLNFLTPSLRARVVTRRWRVGRVCEGCVICRAIELANPNPIGLYDTYRLGHARIVLPAAHPGCDCCESYITDLTDLRAEDLTSGANVDSIDP
jgi:hypothetical protein